MSFKLFRNITKGSLHTKIAVVLLSAGIAGGAVKYHNSFMLGESQMGVFTKQEAVAEVQDSIDEEGVRDKQLNFSLELKDDATLYTDSELKYKSSIKIQHNEVEIISVNVEDENNKIAEIRYGTQKYWVSFADIKMPKYSKPLEINQADEGEVK